MSYFYIDESIHDRGGFILAAAVYSGEDISPKVVEMAKVAGVPEFKSGDRMTPAMQNLRSEILDLVQRELRFGVVVVPSDRRAHLGDQCVLAVQKFVQLNRLPEPHIFLDGGIGVSRPHFPKLHLGQDSRAVGGIQVADCVAHSLSMMLLCALGIVTKTVVFDPEYSEEPLPLDFGYFATLRRSFFIPPINGDDEEFFKTMTCDLGDYALHIDDECNAELREAARERLGRMYLGCIH